MKISEFQIVLENFKKEYGDLEIYIPDSDYGLFPDSAYLEIVEVEETDDTFIDINVCCLK